MLQRCVRGGQVDFDRTQSERPNGGSAMKGALLAALILWVGAMSDATRPAAEESTPGQSLTDVDRALKLGNTDAAQKILKALAKKDNHLAQLRLAEMYENGLSGLKRDLALAVKWYQKAAASGLVAAKARLGHIYLEGVGVMQDFKKARQLLNEAADDGSAQAQFDLGRMWQQGWGGEKNVLMAYAYYEFAAQRGSIAAKKARDALLAKLTPAEAEEGQALLKHLRPGILQPNQTGKSN